MNEKCSYRCVLLFCISIICSIVAIIIRFVDFKSPQISEFGFIGLIATFMGLCATFIVGFQIFNSIEYRRGIDDLRKLQEQYIKDKENMDKKIIELKSGIFFVQAVSFKDTSTNTAYRSYLDSIQYALKINDIEKIDIALLHIKAMINKINAASDLSFLSNETSLNIIKSIKTNSNYKNIRDKFEEVESKWKNLMLKK